MFAILLCFSLSSINTTQPWTSVGTPRPQDPFPKHILFVLRCVFDTKTFLFFFLFLCLRESFCMVFCLRTFLVFPDAVHLIPYTFFFFFAFFSPFLSWHVLPLPLVEVNKGACGPDSIVEVWSTNTGKFSLSPEVPVVFFLECTPRVAGTNPLVPRDFVPPDCKLSFFPFFWSH